MNERMNEWVFIFSGDNINITDIVDLTRLFYVFLFLIV